jgi:hypothetical protein
MTLPVSSLLLIAYMTMNGYMHMTEAGPPPLQAIEATHPQLPHIDVKLNPAPKQSYALIFDFSGLPGNIENVMATADYAVENVECVPAQPVSGARLRPEHSLDLELQRIDANRYAATLHADALTDENYFGLGVCRWVLHWATLRFDSPNNRFIGAISAEQIESNQQQVLHYLTSDYQNPADPPSVVFGEETDLYTVEAGPRFTLTIRSHGVEQ